MPRTPDIPSPKRLADMEKEWAIDHAADAATRAHPEVQKIRDEIKEKLSQAAADGKGEKGEQTPTTREIAWSTKMSGTHLQDKWSKPI